MPLTPAIILAVNGIIVLVMFIFGSIMFGLSIRFRLLVGDIEKQNALKYPILVLLMSMFILAVAVAVFNLLFAFA